jgi:HipA-like C-terminal domain.
MDFTNTTIDKFKPYGGANGNKLSIIHNGERYMLKFPPKKTNKNKISFYSNGCINEYIACQIVKSLGLPVQETNLGIYTDKKGITKIVVACKDFETNNKRLYMFSELKNTCIDSSQNGYGTELEDIMGAIDEQTIIPKDELETFFWNMFIADALLGNFDRHNGNWGFLMDQENQTAEIAPIYNCGSCLYPQLNEESMSVVLAKQEEIEKRVFIFPTAQIKENDDKINYFDFISSLKNLKCNEALIRITSNVNLANINKIINNTSYISEIQREFYKTMIKARKEYILDFSVEKLKQQTKRF